MEENNYKEAPPPPSLLHTHGVAGGSRREEDSTVSRPRPHVSAYEIWGMGPNVADHWRLFESWSCLKCPKKVYTRAKIASHREILPQTKGTKEEERDKCKSTSKFEVHGSW